MQKTTSLQIPRSRPFEQRINPLLRPVLRAYVLGYASSTAPRLLTLLLTHLSRRRKHIDVKPDDTFLASLFRIIKGGIEVQRFPTFCAALVGVSTLAEILLRKVLDISAASLSQAVRLRLTRWLAAFVAGWVSLKLLQSKKSTAFTEGLFTASDGTVVRPKHFAGRTLDLTLFALVRAVDVIVGELWSQRKARRLAAGKWTKSDTAISALTDSAIFASSCALIMWAWIYTPDRLPRSYNKWIKSAAAVDQRLILALQRCRFGEIKYGLETGQAHVLQDMCKDYDLPLEYGDPAKSVPYPCQIVHMGTGTSCEYHALSRFVRSFYWAFSTYLPLNLLLTLRRPSKKGVVYALKSSARSSAFLGTFIALYFYGVCLARSRIGPKILGTSTPACQQIDSGICVGSGCSLCGWSILLETESRRKDIGLFVAPRALATLLPRRYLPENQWRETLAFAMSTGVVFTCVKERPARVRGVLGKILHGVLIP